MCPQSRPFRLFGNLERQSRSWRSRVGCIDGVGGETVNNELFVKAYIDAKVDDLRR